MAFTPKTQSDELDVLSEINVTPFIDVMLVLLIIFMVAAPLSTVSVPLDLPVGSKTAAPPPDEPVNISVRKDLSFYIGETPVKKDALMAEVNRVTKGNKQARLFIRADKSVPYDNFAQLINLLRDNGYLKVALVGLSSASSQ